MCPLRPATDLRLGRLLPCQLANRPRTPLSASCDFPLSGLCGISHGFPWLFLTKRQMIHVLLTRTPLYSPDCSGFLVRLACVKRAASVDSEPGSNSHLNQMSYYRSGLLRVLTSSSLLHPTRLSKICANPPDNVMPEMAAGLETCSDRGPVRTDIRTPEKI